MKTWPFVAAICVIEICSTGCQYDNGGVNVSGVPAAGGTGGTTDPERPPPSGSASGGSGMGGTGGSGSSGVSSVPPMPTKVDAAPAPAADAAAPAPVPPDAAPVSTPPLPVDAPPAADPDPFCPATPDLALCLRFESALVDESPNHLGVQGARPRFAQGRTGMALDSGGNVRVTIPESPALDAPAITIEAWVNARELGPRRTAIVDNPGQYALVVLPSGSIMCSGRGGYALHSNGLSPRRWTHLACTFDASTVTAWVDGQMVRQSPAGPVATEYQQGVRVGWEEDMGSGSFDGLIDSLRIWRVVRAPAPAQ
jgi:hypothetical protein